MKKVIALLPLLLPLAASAQEKIYLKSQKAPLEGTITEIGLNEIKYRPSDAQQLVMSIDKQDLVKIVYQSGRTQFFTDPLQDFSYYKGQKKYIVKVGLLSPLFGYTDLYLEHSQKPGRSVEFQANVIGLGKNLLYERDYDQFRNNDRKMDQKGFSVGAGMKFLRLPDYNTGQLKLRHILQGSYIKPAISIGYYQRNFTTYTTTGMPPYYNTVRKGIVTGNVSVALGKQWVLDNTLSIELYGQIGLGFDNYQSVRERIISDASGSPVDYYMSDDGAHSNFGHLKTGRDDLGLTLNCGLKVGYLFNWKKPKGEQPGQ